MLDLSSLKKGLSRLERPPELILHPIDEGAEGKGESPLAARLDELAERIAEASGGAIPLRRDAEGPTPPARPALTIAHPGRGAIHYLALPEGPEEGPFLDALLGGAEGGAGMAPISELDRPARLAVFIAAACPHCPGAVRNAHRLALAGPRVSAAVIDAQLFPELAERFHAQSVPLTVLDEDLSLVGVVPADDLAARILGRESEEHPVRVLLSLVEQNRLEEAQERILAEGGPAALAAAWRRSATSARISLMMAAERILEEDRAALDACVPHLLEVLHSEDANLRGDSADLLGRIGHPSALPDLERLRGDPNPDVAEIAAEAVEEIGERSASGS